MVKRHLKRLAMPRTWKLKRKENTWIARPDSGAHCYRMSVSLETMMKEMIKCAHTRKEAKTIINSRDVMVDQKKQKNLKLPVGLMDVVSLPEVDEHYRVLLNSRGEISVIPIKKEESSVKPCRITGKTVMSKGAIQLNLVDSRNILAKKDDAYKVGDTLLLSLPKQEIKEHLKLEKGAYAFLTGGKHIGRHGLIEGIKGNIIKLKSGEDLIETAKKDAFVIGKGKPSIKLE